MIGSWVVILSALVYLCALFAIAHFGDTSGRTFVRSGARGTIYALSIGVYCTSLTFFGSVGVATSAGLDFLPIYIGPFIAFVFCRGLISRMIRIAKSQNITSIADFMSARYGKSEAVAALVAIVAVIAGVPYIALQLKALSASLSTVLQSLEAGHPAVAHSVHGAPPFVLAMILAGFAMAFGTRRVDATEHQDGLVLAIATESIIKLAAFLIVGLYVTFGAAPVAQSATAVDTVSLSDLVARSSNPMNWVSATFLSFSAILLLPRQFHVTVVENRDERDLRTARWLFPVYLVAINLFVLPIAQAGLALFPGADADRDMTVLTVPIAGQNGLVMLVALIGGLSAAAAMVIVSSVALSIMVSNDLVVPLLVRRGSMSRRSATHDVSARILVIRRVAILAILLLSYVYYSDARDTALASIGLLSFAAIAQIMPGFLAAFVWSRGTSRGAMAGLCVGTALWAYTLFLPSFNDVSPWLESVLRHGPFGIGWLRPTALFGTRLPALTHGVVWSMAGNVLAFVGISLMRRPSAIEKLQASLFSDDVGPIAQTLRRWGATVTEGDLETTVARYLGAEQTRRAFDEFLGARGRIRHTAGEADVHILEFAERLLASGIGAASSRLVLSLLLRRGRISARAAFQLLDDAASAIHHNRDLLQHAIDHARQGIAVIDKDLRLICWNREYRDLFDLPPELLRVGVGIDEIIEYNADRGLYGPGSTRQIVSDRIDCLTTVVVPSRLRLHPSGRVIEIRSAQMPDGGTVTTYTDVTESVAFQQSLEAANESLERRVRERTEELERLNTELATAKARADEANVSKTRFLAAASHDILQPLNAARLYTTTLVEQTQPGGADGIRGRRGKPVDGASLAHNIDASLEAVEEILTALLDISRLDGDKMRIERSNFRIEEVLRQLALEFGPSVAEKGLDLRLVGCSTTVRSDRRLLRRLLQNLVSNAIKYTPQGRVLIGCRRRGKNLSIQVWDTGIGIAPEQQKIVFREFERLEQGAKVARGLGLGLSIVERLANVLEHRLSLESQVGAGSMFALEVPVMPALPAAASNAPASMAAVTHPFAGLCVLVIDNEPRILDGMEAMLGGWGCLVIKAESLEQAEQALKAARRVPDVVVTDYHLDKGDGIEAITALRWKFGLDLPAALLTADRSPDVREAALAKGVQVLSKPVKPAALRALLSQWRTQRAAAE